MQNDDLSERRGFLSVLGLGGIAAIVAAVPSVAAAKSGQSTLPPGKGFLILQQQIDALKELLGEIGDGTFEMLRVVSNDPNEPSVLYFGPTDECSIGIDPVGGLTGLLERDPVGFRLLGRNDQGCRLLFGPTDLCTVEVDPQGPAGLLLRDPEGIRILPNTNGNANANANASPTLFFGATDDCRIMAGPGLGMIVWDPDGLVIRNPQAGDPNRLSFGTAGSPCCIQAGGMGPDGSNLGMIFEDPDGFLFQNPLNPNAAELQVDGLVEANEFVQSSSAAFKENVAPLDGALESIKKLQGVRFDWRPEKGGTSSIGFIAEEVDQVFPELVRHEENGSASGVSYANLVAVAIEGIKEQQQQVARLEAEKSALETQVAELRTQLSDLEGKIDQLLART